MTDLPREIALRTLYDINEKGAYSNISLNKHLEAYELKNIDRAFVTELVYGTVKWKLTIDWIIGQFSSIRMKKISPWVLDILRMGIYQLLFTDRVPESAACNESVNLAKRFGHSASSGYVNAVLRSVARNRDGIKYPDPEKEYIKFLSIKHSHPEWMVDKWVKLYGEEFTGSLLRKNNEVPDFTIRVNSLKVSREKLAENLRAAGLEVRYGKYVDEALVIENPSSITKLEAFVKGYFQVQDESSMAVAHVLDPKPGETVVDVCSAPGGKATHIAQLMDNKGIVVARDIHEHKIRLIADAAERLGIDIIKTQLFDASRVDERLVGKADRVLVDAPCTGLGIIRRKPDIKWERNAGDKEEIIGLQKKILNASSYYVKPGGVLVYSTCTISPEENEEVVKEFTGSNSFELDDITPLLPTGLLHSGSGNGCLQLFPNIDDVDGFFMARMIRRR